MAKENNQPLLFVFAGPNGSGKSTITPIFQSQTDFPQNYINPDEIALTLGGNTIEKAYEASAIAAQERFKCIEEKQSFAFETVMSHPSKLAILETAKQAGFETRLIFVSTDNPLINVERVKQRVIEGGHDVPEDKIVSRYHRALSLLPKAAEIADRTFVFDHSVSLKKEITLSEGKIIEQSEETSKWVENTIKTLDERQQERLEINQTNSDSLTASLNKGEYLGKIKSVGKHFVTQQTKDGQIVVHENLILNLDRSVAGRDAAINYRNGVHNIDIQQEKSIEQPLDTSQPIDNVYYNLASSAKYLALNQGIKETDSNNHKQVYKDLSGMLIEKDSQGVSIFCGDKSICFDRDFNVVYNNFSEREIRQLNQQAQAIKQQTVEQNLELKNSQDSGLSL
jgi:predicted ABC-type ATPase/L-rhamnose mutarotase